MPRIRNYEELRDRLVELDRIEASLWISPEWVSKDVNEIFKEKRELALEIIGHQLSDEKFEKMLNNIKTNPELQKLLDDLMDRDIEVWNYNYSYKKCIDAKRAIDKDIKNLVNNRDFRGYVKETLSKNSTALFEKDAFVSGWDKYQAELKNARENRANPVMFGEKNDPGRDC